MKILSSVLFVIISVFAHAQVNWISFSELEAAIKEKPKPIIVDMYTTWCGPCKMMDKNTFQNPKVAAYINEHFYAVKFNAEGNEIVHFKGKEIRNKNYDPNKAGRNATHPFAGNFAVEGRLAYPTTAYLSPNLDMITQPIQGYLTPDRIEPILKFFGSGAYLEKTWDEFQKTFVAEW
ncbi:MAG: DUF255 domain-containing protein [Cryomorphaceae bacterium]|nr:DUF255 domain-containing protein [Cryomorphaceae bacterium]